MRLAERPVPEPGPGQVRVRLVRAGVNPTDWKARAAVSSPMGFAEVKPGQDGAGAIDALSEDVHGLAAGDRVSRIRVFAPGPARARSVRIVRPAPRPGP
jgi:NADPH2:quinone reductase